MAWKGVHLTKPRGSRLPTANAASSRMTVKSAIGREPLVRFGPTISPIKPTTGKSVGKPRLLPKCCDTHAQPTTGKSVGKPRRRNTNPQQSSEPTTRKSVGKPASQMRMEAETGRHGCDLEATAPNVLHAKRQKPLGRRPECYSFCKLLAQRSVRSILATDCQKWTAPGPIAPTSSRLELGCSYGRACTPTPRTLRGLT
jgi:hypothetical protein